MEKQQTIFSEDTDLWHIFVDGASRGNPGPAGAGIIIAKNSKLIECHGYFLGTKTNNQAEYMALLISLFLITEQFHITKGITIFSDSELLVRQISGVYRVKNDSLISLYNRAKSSMAQMNYAIKHIPRSENSYADAMANKGIDGQKLPPEQFFIWINR